MAFDTILAHVQAVAEYRPIWVACLVLSVTQMGKVAILGKMNDGLHTIITRIMSGATGAASGYFLLDKIAGDHLGAAFFGLAISAAISLAYAPFTDWLESDPNSGWKTGLADFLSGRTFKPPVDK